MTEASQAPPDEGSPDHLTHVHKRKSQPPMPRDKRGWQVAPAPDGRGTPPSTQRPMHRSRGFIYFIVASLFFVVFSEGRYASRFADAASRALPGPGRHI